MNVQISCRMYENPRVSMINADQILSLDNQMEHQENLMQSDGYHLTQLGFQRMIDNWTGSLVGHIRSNTTQNSHNPLFDSEEDVLSTKEENASPGPMPVKETVPDPFGMYAAPEDVVVSPKSGKEATAELTDEPNDDDIPNLETVEPQSSSKAVKFKLGRLETVDGDGFIEDDYCGINHLTKAGSELLPSLNLASSGPESDFGPVSGKLTVVLIFQPLSSKSTSGWLPIW